MPEYYGTGCTKPGPHLSLRFCLLAVLILLLLVGVVGNLLTLVALPYVRRKYGAQFSVLKSTTFVLLLHLSLCDLLYISFGFTHFIHVLIVGNVQLFTYYEVIFNIFGALFECMYRY